jgi:hypothetical protein
MITRRTVCLFVVTIATAVVAGSGAQAQPKAPTLKASFVMNKTDGKLAHVRALKTILDDGSKKTPGYAVLISAKPAEGDILPWRTAEAKERGSFIYLLLEANGDVWVAQLAHTVKSGSSIGVVTEVKKVAFAVKDGRISGQYRTNGEESFFDDRFTIDLTFDAPLEGK